MKATTMLVIIAVLSIMASSVPLQVVSNIQTTSNSQNLAVNTNQNFWLGSQNSVLYQCNFFHKLSRSSNCSKRALLYWTQWSRL